jgi:exonuclease VII large subunit
LPAALDLPDQHVLHRARLLDDHDTNSVAALRAADPSEAVPPIIRSRTATLARFATSSKRLTRANEPLHQRQPGLRDRVDLD